MFADIYLRKPEKFGFLSFIPTTQISINISLKSKATGVFTPVAALLFDVKGLPFIGLAILLQVPFFKLLAVLLILEKLADGSSKQTGKCFCLTFNLWRKRIHRPVFASNLRLSICFFSRSAAITSRAVSAPSRWT